MKKVISFVVAIALVLSMSVCAFAATEKPTGTPADGAALGAYYAELLNSGEVEASVIAGQIVADYQDGTIDETTAQAFVDALFANADSTDSATAVIQQVIVGLDSLGIAIPNIELPGTGDSDSDTPEITLPEITLPEDEGGDEGGSFFDTIFGILGDLAGSLLGGDSGSGSGDGEGSGDGDGDDLGFNDGDETTTNGTDSQVTNTGDTSVVAVATVALVAGAALVLTRKKSDDAE